MGGEYSDPRWTHQPMGVAICLHKSTVFFIISTKLKSYTNQEALTVYPCRRVYRLFNQPVIFIAIIEMGGVLVNYFHLAIIIL